MKQILIDGRPVGDGAPFYSIAEIGSNFDQDIEKAKRLVDLAIDCGADAVKFQSFKAEKLVSDEGFQKLKVGYQAQWTQTVSEVYKSAEFPSDWHQEIFDYCKEKGITFFSAPYDRESVDMLDAMGIPVFKIGSGDVTWLEMVDYIAKKGKPIILATGASTMEEVENAVNTIKNTGNNDIVLLQCVTNYPASFDNINLRVLETYRNKFDCLVGYSDHTPGSIVAVGTVALGGCMIEKHFTDDKSLPGPDHGFAMDGEDFKAMVRDIRRMEQILGNPDKAVYPEERNQYVSMKRGIRAVTDLKSGDVISRNDIAVLRPCEQGTLRADQLDIVVGKQLATNVQKGQGLTVEDLV